SIVASTDGGLTWNAVATGPSGAGRMTLGMGSAGDSTLYAIAANAGDSAGLDLFKSTDGGQNWGSTGLSTSTLVNPNFELSNVVNIMGGQAWYNQMILVDPTDGASNTVYLGGNLHTAKTTDGGATWRLTSNWLSFFGLPYVHADCHTAVFSM